MTWYVINTRDGTTTPFEDSDEAMTFYNKTCVDWENKICWGAYIQRPKGFFK